MSSADPETDDENNSPGWDAIDRALFPIYGPKPPLHWAPELPMALGGEDPLDGISIYPRELPTPHWHYVTYGFSELYGKESENLEESGWGFELTFRLAVAKLEEQPPTWPLSFLQNLGRYVFRSGNPFSSGHYLDLNGPIALGTETNIRAIAFGLDPELPAIDTPNGKLEFLQIVGLTLDEMSALKIWDTAGVLDALRQRSPLLITDLDRPSLLEDPQLAQFLAEGAAREGSSSHVLFVEVARWEILPQERLLLVVGANGMKDFRAILPGRLLHGQPLSLASKQKCILWEPGPQAAWRLEGDTDLILSLPDELTREIAARLAPKAGLYTFPSFPALEIQVEPSAIKDRDGNVIETIG